MTWDISFMDVVLILTIIGLFTVLMWTMENIIEYIKLKKKYIKQKTEHEQLRVENENKTVAHSEAMMNLIRTIVGQIAVLKFREFQDKHKMDPEINTDDGWKINRQNFETLIEDIARSSLGSLNIKNIDFDELFFTQKFYENYIIQTSIMIVKQMLEKSIDDLVEYRQ